MDDSFLRHKPEVFEKFKEFEAINPNEHVQRIGTLRTKHIEISYRYDHEARREGICTILFVFFVSDRCQLSLNFLIFRKC